ncbi:MAG: hypothetical protein RQ733_13850 [Methyloprofundus sp.]|nr:hypothetical protein [Methyloprofundus sp.]
MNIKQLGMTLIELSVVLLILIALAGLAVPYVSGISSTSLCKATDITLSHTKKAIMEGFYIDTLGYFPKATKSTTADFNLTYLLDDSAAVWGTFNPETRLGWHGPYLDLARKLTPSDLTSTFTDTNFVHVALTISDYGVFDGWNHPIILQKHSTDDFRLVSAGFNGDLETKITDSAIGGDDRVLYVNKPSPVTNSSCG